MTSNDPYTDTGDAARAPELERIDPYQQWRTREGVPLVGGVYVRDMRSVDVGDWPRKGVKGAICYLDGDDANDAHIVEVPPGKSTNPERHLYDETFYMLSGRGATTIWFDESTKQTFEWAEGSFFALPTNAWFQFFNGSGSEPARYFSITTLPKVIREFHSEDFIFNNNFAFTDRYAGEDTYFDGQGKLWRGRLWETNFVPDVREMKLWEWKERGGGGTNAGFLLAGGTLRSHASRFQQGTYKKGHGSEAGAHIFIVDGAGYTTTVLEPAKGTLDGPMIRCDWQPGSLLLSGSGPGYWYHQHFNLSAGWATYLVMGRGLSPRYATNRWEVDAPTDRGPGEVDVKKGGTQTEYRDEDPEVHRVFEEELRRRGLVCRMKALSPFCTGEEGPTEQGEWEDDH